MTKVKVERAVIEALGGDEKFNAEISRYSEALKDHANTENVPAPTTHPHIESIVKNFGGKYEVLEPTPLPEAPELPDGAPIAPPPEPPPVPEYTEAEWRQLRLDELARYRNHLRVWASVQFGGHKFWASLNSQSELIAAKDQARDDPNYVVSWKDADNHNVLLDKDAIFGLTATIRANTQMLFNREADVADRIKVATKKRLQFWDVKTEWGTN